MAATLNPYLSFAGDALVAMEHYRSVLGGELTRMTFGEMGLGEPADAEKTMHSQLVTPGGMTLMGSDVPASMGGPGPNGAVSLSGGAAEANDLRAWFDGLADGGSVDQPLVAAPWGDSFGMCTDKFGVRWMVNIASA